MYVKTLTIPQAAEILDVGHETICTYLGNGKLSGNRKLNQVTLVSLDAYRQSIIPQYAAIVRVLVADDGLTDAERGFDPEHLPVRLPRTGLVDRERAILRARLDELTNVEIAKTWGVSSDRVRLIILGAIKRLAKS